MVPAGVNECECALAVAVTFVPDTVPAGVNECVWPVSDIVIVGVDTVPPAVVLLTSTRGSLTLVHMPPSLFSMEVLPCVPPLLYASEIEPTGVNEWLWLPTVADVVLSYVCVWAFSVTAVPVADAVTPAFVVPVLVLVYVGEIEPLAETECVWD